MVYGRNPCNMSKFKVDHSYCMLDYPQAILEYYIWGTIEVHPSWIVMFETHINIKHQILILPKLMPYKNICFVTRHDCHVHPMILELLAYLWHRYSLIAFLSFLVDYTKTGIGSSECYNGVLVKCRVGNCISDQILARRTYLSELNMFIHWEHTFCFTFMTIGILKYLAQVWFTRFTVFISTQIDLGF